MTPPLYSIRMHATRQGGHLSGAERLGGRQDLESLAAALLRRALEHPRGEAEQIRLTVEALPAGTVAAGRLPDLTTIAVADYLQGRQAALRLLVEAGVSEAAACAAIEALAQGASPTGGSMRGAMLVDAESGERLEPDLARGVRASRMDLSPEAEKLLGQRLAERGLDNPHVREALVLAAKVLSAPGVVAELCWSDDPDYTAGYVASPAGGYQRMPHLKPRGEERGGRAFFVRRAGLDLPALTDYLQNAALLITEVGRINGETEWEN